MESDECDESVSSPGAEQEETQCQSNYNNLVPEKEFILKYESLPQLWDTSDVRYCNKYERYQALTKLLPIYKKIKPYATVEDIKKKINSLRSNYRREMKKYTSGENGRYYPKVWYFPYLSFLKKLEHVDGNFQDTSIPLGTETPEHIQSEKIQKQSAIDQGTLLEKKSNILRALCLESKARSPKFKKKILYREQMRGHQRSQPYEPEHHCPKISNPLALEWSETLARLDPLQKLFAKKAINDVLFEAELGNLHKDSVQINESNSYYLNTSPNNEDDEPPPGHSVQISNPISTKNSERTRCQDYKIPISFLHCNIEDDGQTSKDTEHDDQN